MGPDGGAAARPQDGGRDSAASAGGASSGGAGGTKANEQGGARASNGGSGGTTTDAGTHGSTGDAGPHASTTDAGSHASIADAGARGLTGSTVTATLYNPDLSHILGGPATAVVGASDPTFPNGKIIGNTTFQINVTSHQIIYKPLTDVTYGNGTFNGFTFAFANAPTIVGVTLDPASNFKPKDISFTGTSVNLNLSANTVTTTSVAILDVQLTP